MRPAASLMTRPIAMTGIDELVIRLRGLFVRGGGGGNMEVYGQE